MISVSINNGWEDWRRAARRLAGAGTRPEDVVWSATENRTLFDSESIAEQQTDIRVPPEFINLAETVACFDDPNRWALLYSLLYRTVFENRDLLEIESDADVAAVRRMEKAVRRDIHKFHAFVRFRRAEIDGKEIFLAWHEPQHFTVERSVPFFVRRFGSMNFSILTPKGSAHWDTQKLSFGPAAARSEIPEEDRTEEFWLAYYRSIFNPFRLKVQAMKKELPVRHWRTLPEAVLIRELISDAASGVKEDA